LGFNAVDYPPVRGRRPLRNQSGNRRLCSAV